MSVEKWWNEICGRGKRAKPREKPYPDPSHMEGPRRELGTPAVGGERLTACATRPPLISLIYLIRKTTYHGEICTQQ